MKIKLDENLPERLVAVLTGLGHDLDTVRTEQLTGHGSSDSSRSRRRESGAKRVRGVSPSTPGIVGGDTRTIPVTNELASGVSTPSRTNRRTLAAQSRF